MPVFIRCKKCASEQQSQSIQMTSQQTFEAMKDKMEVKNETCKNCGTDIEVNSKTAYWSN